MTGTPYRPITLGHETAGTVVAVGQDVAEPVEGDRVVINPILSCGDCTPCRRGRPHICERRQVLGIHTEGAFAEYVRVPARNLAVLPDGLSLLEAAVIEPMATPYHALTSRAPVRPGSSVAIVGVGGLGIHGVQVARMLGATTIIAVDLDEVALERARSLGATLTVNPAEVDAVATVRDSTGGGVDVALECVGLPSTVQQSVELLRGGGIAAIIGIGSEPALLPPVLTLVRLELEVRGVYAYSHVEVNEVARLIASGHLDAKAAISATYPLASINEGLDHFRSRRGSPVRVLIHPEEINS
jgi:threonine dehydrogenase-like Zn-dependent dehydrogenase